MQSLALAMTICHSLQIEAFISTSPLAVIFARQPQENLTQDQFGLPIDPESSADVRFQAVGRSIEVEVADVAHTWMTAIESEWRSLVDQPTQSRSYVEDKLGYLSTSISLNDRPDTSRIFAAAYLRAIKILLPQNELGNMLFPVYQYYILNATTGVQIGILTTRFRPRPAKDKISNTTSSTAISPIMPATEMVARSRRSVAARNQASQAAVQQFSQTIAADEAVYLIHTACTTKLIRATALVQLVFKTLLNFAWIRPPNLDLDRTSGISPGATFRQALESGERLEITLNELSQGGYQVPWSLVGSAIKNLMVDPILQGMYFHTFTAKINLVLPQGGLQDIPCITVEVIA